MCPLLDWLCISHVPTTAGYYNWGPSYIGKVTVCQLQGLYLSFWLLIWAKSIPSILCLWPFMRFRKAKLKIGSWSEEKLPSCNWIWKNTLDCWEKVAQEASEGRDSREGGLDKMLVWKNWIAAVKYFGWEKKVPICRWAAEEEIILFRFFSFTTQK